MSVHIETVEGYPDTGLVEEICRMEDPPFPVDAFEGQLSRQHRIFGCYAYENDRLVGYKIGYEPRPRYFESWLGAVHPEYRRQGIAERLMDVQHRWCEEKGYRFITTNAAASNNPMLILNLKSGFVISGTLLDRGNNYKVFLQKSINSDEEEAGT